MTMAAPQTLEGWLEGQISFSGHERANYGRNPGTDARKVADSQQVVRKGCPGRRTLDQESPGSSPGGATRRSDTTSVGRTFWLLRPLLPSSEGLVIPRRCRGRLCWSLPRKPHGGPRTPRAIHSRETPDRLP
jgi:hypothetical protein